MKKILDVDIESFKKFGKELIVDAAQVVVFGGVAFTVSKGLTILYDAYYKTSTVSSDAFSAMIGQFAIAVSLFYLLKTVKTHKIPKGVVEEVK